MALLAPSTLASMESLSTSHGPTETLIPNAFRSAEATRHGRVQAARVVKVRCRNLPDSSHRNLCEGKRCIKSQAGQDRNLVARIQAIYVQAGISLCITGGLRLLQGFVKLHAMCLHLR